MTIKGLEIPSAPATEAIVAFEPNQTVPAVTTLAVFTSVSEIKRVAENMSPAECHALAVYFALRSTGPPQQVMGHQTSTIAAKNVAAIAFASPSSEWNTILGQYATDSGMTVEGYNIFHCNCKCGCTNIDGKWAYCELCKSICCIQCKPVDRFRLNYRYPAGGTGCNIKT